MHVCRTQEVYMWNSSIIITILEKISKILEEMGCQRNEYDWCVMNTIVNDKNAP